MPSRSFLGNEEYNLGQSRIPNKLSFCRRRRRCGWGFCLAMVSVVVVGCQRQGTTANSDNAGYVQRLQRRTRRACMYVYQAAVELLGWLAGWQYNITIISEAGAAAAAEWTSFCCTARNYFSFPFFSFPRTFWDGSKIRSPFVLSLPVILCCEFWIIIKCDRLLLLLAHNEWGCQFFDYYIFWDSHQSEGGGGGGLPTRYIHWGWVSAESAREMIHLLRNLLLIWHPH